ncbi:hypothetical protein IHE61_27325 [Streptomyces sp. GKU 257-1]|nr:hypothetical protein [Streptomyces sp. GKU 257-1]
MGSHRGRRPSRRGRGPVAWVEERVARELGLITDGTFPRSVARAWDRVHTQAKAWEAADGAYWALRRDLPDLRDAVRAALAGRSLARRRRDAAGHVLRAAGLGARERFEAAVAAADEVLELPAAELSPGSRTRLAPALAAAAQASEDVREAVLGQLLVPPEAGAERHRAAEEGLAAARELRREADAEVARLRRAERDHLVQEAARARDRRMAEPLAELGTAERAVSAAADTLRRAERALTVRLRRIEEQHAAAESAADALFEIRAAADRLTRWHQLPADPVADGAAPTRGGMPEPVLPPVRRPDRERTAGAPHGLPTVPEAQQAETGPDRRTGTPHWPPRRTTVRAHPVCVLRTVRRTGCATCPGTTPSAARSVPPWRFSPDRPAPRRLPAARTGPPSPPARPSAIRPRCVPGSPTRWPRCRTTRRSWATSPRTSATPSPRPNWPRLRSTWATAHHSSGSSRPWE